MIVQCPECHTKYRLSAYLLGRKGRDVRCSSCRHVWFHAATKAELDAEAEEAVLVFEEADRQLTVQELEEEIASHHEDEPEETEIDEAPAEETEGANDNAMEWRFIAASFAAFLFLTLLVGLVFPERVIQHFPQTFPVYRAIGFVGFPLALQAKEASYREGPGGRNMLFVALEMVNTADEEQMEPPLAVTLLDQDRRVLKIWEVPARGQAVAPESAKTELKFSLADAPPGGKTVVIRRDLHHLYGILDKDQPEEKADNHGH
jgi:predicted Zn finger-like uncharacterized protein